MDIGISDRVLEATTKCKKDFCCLNGKGDLCTIADCVNDQILFVQVKDGEYCPYKQQFGNEFICGCPVRKELFDKYRI